MEKQEERKLLEILQKHNILFLYIVSLISADNLLTIENCETNLNNINFCLEIIDENNINDKENIRKMLLDGKEIILRDMKYLKEKNMG